MLDNSIPPEDNLSEPPAEDNIEVDSDGESDVQADIALDTELQTREAVAHLQEMEALDPHTWQSLDLAARLETLQSIEDTMANIQGRPSMPIEAEEMEANEFGGYVDQGIRLNISHLQSDMPVEEFINTIVHEGRHAYQDFAVQNPGVIDDEDLVDAWADNQQNYFDPELYGQEIYATQPIEEDASNYANRITNTLIAGSLGELEY